MPDHLVHVRFVVLTRIIRAAAPASRLERDMALQGVLSAFATGSFLTGTAVFFTRIVGLSGAEVGLGLSIAGVVAISMQLPMGRLTDRVGSKPLWALASLVEAVLYLSWPLIEEMVAFVALLSALAVVETAARSSRGVYRISVFPRATRVRALAYMRSARNVGYTLGAGTSGVALGVGERWAIVAIPLLAAALLLLNAAMVSIVLPAIEAPLPQEPLSDETSEPTGVPSAWRNPGFVVLSACNGVLSSNQVLLNVVVPLWLVERTDAPDVLLAWLFGTNTVLAVLLQVRASRGSDTVPGALRAVKLCGLSFVMSCVVVSFTHETTGWLSIVLIWLGHITITGAELWQSAADWGFQTEVSDHRRLGDYQGVWGVGYQLEPVIFPALYTFLVLQWGTPGWAVIAVIAAAAAALAHPAARAADRHLESIGAPRGA